MPFRLLAAMDDDQRRLDRILRKALPELPLSALHRLLRQGKITVNGHIAAGETRINAGQLIEIPELAKNNEKILQKNQLTGDKKPCETPLQIIFEGEGLLVLNKKRGIAVHGKESLEEQVLAYLKPVLSPSLSFRPGPLHRLDKPTSGLIVFSANLKGAQYFSALLRERRIRKCYLAIVDGILPQEETWEDNLFRDRETQKTFASIRGGKKAITRLKPLAAANNRTLVLAEIETGFTHQIRAQAAYHGHPLSGDRKYNGAPFPCKKNAENRGSFGYFLHAWKLELPDPAPLPQYFIAPPAEEFCLKIMEIFGKEALKIISENQSTTPLQARTFGSAGYVVL